jgi:hypothetical protein
LIAASVCADDGDGDRSASGSASVFTGPPERATAAMLLCAMTRRVPARAAAASRLSVPRVRRSLVAVNSLSTLRMLRMSGFASAVIWCRITSGSAASTAAITASRSSASRTTGSAPASRSPGTLPADLVVAVTS